MERLSALGLSWRHGDLDRIARFTPPEEERPELLRRLAAGLGAQELVYLSTCNRVELVFVRPPGSDLAALRGPAYGILAGRPPTPGETERTFRAWSGEGAVEHLFLIAGGLDSAQLGETEVSGQVRRAMELSREQGRLGPHLAPLFEDALRLARRIQRETEVGMGRTSLAELALEVLRDRLAETGGAVALVGVSPMTERAAKALAADGIPLVVVNRSPGPARELAARTGGQARSLDGFRRAPDAVEGLVSATAAPGAVLDRAALERLAAASPSGRGPLLVDLALPPDVDPEAAEATGLERVDIQALTERAASTRDARLAAAGDARVLVDEALDRWRRARAERALGPLLAALQRHYQATARTGVERLLSRDLAGLGEAEAEAVHRWAQALARRFAHLPTTGLRELAAEHGTPALQSYFRRADRDLADELGALDEALAEPPPLEESA